VRRDFLVFVSPLARTDRHTSSDGGVGGSASGSPSRSAGVALHLDPNGAARQGQACATGKPTPTNQPLP